MFELIPAEWNNFSKISRKTIANCLYDKKCELVGKFLKSVFTQYSAGRLSKIDWSDSKYMNN